MVWDYLLNSLVCFVIAIVIAIALTFFLPPPCCAATGTFVLLALRKALALPCA